MLLLLEFYIYSRWILVLFMDLISYYYYYHSFLIVNDSFHFVIIVLFLLGGDLNALILFNELEGIRYTDMFVKHLIFGRIYVFLSIDTNLIHGSKSTDWDPCVWSGLGSTIHSTLLLLRQGVGEKGSDKISLSSNLAT